MLFHPSWVLQGGNCHSRLLGTFKHNLESQNSKNSEFIPKREKSGVVMVKSQEHSPGLGCLFGSPCPHTTTTLKLWVNVLSLFFSEELKSPGPQCSALKFCHQDSALSHGHCVKMERVHRDSDAN